MKTKIYQEKSPSHSGITRSSMLNPFLKKILLLFLFITVSSQSYSFVAVNLHFFIQGYYIGNGVMNPALYNQCLSSSDIEVDVIRVDLYCYTAATFVASYNGTLNIYGDLTCYFPNVNSDYYYIVINHRNSIQTWSATPVYLDASAPLYNFNVPANVYGGNLFDFLDGNYGIYNGDVNQDCYIATDDVTLVDNDNLLGLSPCGSYVTDVDGDGYVSTGDVTITDNNNSVGVTCQFPLEPFVVCGGYRMSSPEDSDLYSASLTTYPNPAKSFVKIQSSDSFGDGTVLTLHNLLGEKVKSIALPANRNIIDISIEDLSPGVYECSLINNNSFRAKTKIVVVK